MTPRRAGVIPKTAWSEETRMSQAIASSSPPPKAKPFSMAITGAGNDSTERIMSSKGLLESSTCASPDPPAGIAVMSYPAQNASSPSPRSTTHRVSSPERSEKAFRSSPRIFRFSAFFLAGWETVTVATGPSLSTVTFPPILPSRSPGFPGHRIFIRKRGACCNSARVLKGLAQAGDQGEGRRAALQGGAVDNHTGGPYNFKTSFYSVPAHHPGERRTCDMAPEYPKEVKVRDGSTIVLKPFEKKDKDALFLFFQKLPEEDRLFLKDNVTDPAVVERWAVIARDFQRLGLGSILANELFLHALKCGLEKIVAEMMETQQGAKKVFEKLGFRQEAVFHGHVRDQIGVRHDLLVLTKDLEDFWANIQTHEYFSYPSRPMEG